MLTFNLEENPGDPQSPPDFTSGWMKVGGHVKATGLTWRIYALNCGRNSAAILNSRTFDLRDKRRSMSDHKRPVSAHIRARFFPESAVSGFSHVDMTIGFYSQIAAILKPEDWVLDFGAGRGEPITDDPIHYRRQLVNFKGRCAHVAGCDVDPAIKFNPYLDSASLLSPGEPLRYADHTFDIIVSRYVFEHLIDPAQSVAEMLRVLKPGGWICAATPNRSGYIAIAASLFPNYLHKQILRRVQPEREARDIFPTVYRLNSIRAMKRYFGPYGRLFVFRHSSEPAYHFNNQYLYGLFKTLHKILPDAWQTTIFMYFQKSQ